MKIPEALKKLTREICEEFRKVTGKHLRLLEAALPLTLFLLLSPLLGQTTAGVLALLTGLVAGVHALKKGRSPLFCAAGLLFLGIGVALAVYSGRTGTFFLPNLGMNGLICLLCLVSLPLKKPVAAWASHFARHYPLSWYWHPRVRPAYTEVTAAWSLFFGLRALLQVFLIRSGRDVVLALFSLLSGWPAIMVLMVSSYLYGTWRLRRLGGPGIDEYRRGDPPPWRGQTRGF